MRFVPPADLSAFSGYIFDCDGTLADTMAAHFRAWRRALADGGAQFEFTWEVFLSRAGMSMERTVIELGEQFGQSLDERAIAAGQRKAFAELEREVAPVHEVLDFARKVAQDFPVSVASGSSRPSVERTLERIGATELFPIIVTPEDVQHGKPAPDMFFLAAERMSVEPRRCLVIEDGALGIEAARRARMQCAVVSSLAPEV